MRWRTFLHHPNVQILPRKSVVPMPALQQPMHISRPLRVTVLGPTGSQPPPLLLEGPV